MIRKLASLSKSSFVRNVAVVATGTAGAQAISMVFAPIITRLYGPEAFGALGTFMAILAVLTPIAALSYPIAMVLPKRDADALELAKLSMRIALVTSLLTGLILMLFKEPIVSAFNLESIEAYVLLLPVAMVFSAALGVMSQWVIRKKLFRTNAKVAVLQALWLNSAKAGIGLIYPVAAVLVVFATLGSVLQALMLWVGIRKISNGRMGLADSAEPGLTSGKELAWRHRDFAYYRTPQIVLNAASQSLPVLMLASFFGPAAAGFYSLGRMVLAVPTSLVGGAVSSVFYPRFNESVQNGEDSYRMLLKSTAVLSILGLAPFGFIVAFGPWIFTFIFGSGWYTAGVYAQWLALWSYFGFINRPSVGAIPVLSLQGFFLTYEIVSVAVRGLALFMGFWVYESAVMAVALFSIVSAFLNVSLILITLAAARKRVVGCAQ